MVLCSALQPGVDDGVEEEAGDDLGGQLRVRGGVEGVQPPQRPAQGQGAAKVGMVLSSDSVSLCDGVGWGGGKQDDSSRCRQAKVRQGEIK